MNILTDEVMGRVTVSSVRHVTVEADVNISQLIKIKGEFYVPHTRKDTNRCPWSSRL
jgi:hypothetical protein